MATVCQIYDETNAVVLYDLNDPTASNVGDNAYSSTELLADVDLGSPAQEFSRFTSPGSDGGTTVNSRAGFRQVTLGVRVRGSSYDNLTNAVGKLSTYLRNGCVIRWQANTSANVRYIDVEPSPSPYVLDGRELSMYLATSLIDTPEGLELVLTAQPYLRGAELDSATTVNTNATLLRGLNSGANAPMLWSWTSTSNISAHNIDAAAEAYEVTIATTGNRDLEQNTAVGSFAVGEVATGSFYAQTDSGTTGARMLVRIQYLDAAAAALVTHDGTLTTLTSGWQRITYTAPAAPASTSRALIGLMCQNLDAGSKTIRLRNAQIEKASTVSAFHVGTQSGIVDPAPTAGFGRVFPFYNPGDAPAPVKVTAGNPSSTMGVIDMGVASNPNGTGSGLLTDFMNTAHLFQIEDWTNGTDAAGSVQAGASPGSGTSAKLVTFGTTSLVSRATTSVTSGATIRALQGKTFMPHLRIGGSTSSVTITAALVVKWGSGGDGVTVTEDLISGAAGGYTDRTLEPITFPDYYPDSLTLDLQAARTGGAGNLILDCICLIPTEPYASYEHGTGVLAAHAFQTDAATNDVRIVTVSNGRFFSPSVHTIHGPALFWAKPGLSLLYVNLVTSSFADVRGDTQTVRYQFSPRYLS